MSVAASSPARPIPHWARLGESTFVAGVWFLYGCYRLFGRWPFRLLLLPVVAWYWATRRLARRASADYLGRLAAATGQPRTAGSFAHLFRFADTLLDKLVATSGRLPRGAVRFEGAGHVEALLEAGRGGLFLTAHMGCLEAMQAAAGWRRGLRINILVHTAHAERFNRVLERLNPGGQVRLLQVTALGPELALDLARRVEAGEFLAIAADRVPVQGDRVVRVPFLGQPAPFPAGPYLVASLLQCPVFTLTCTRAADGRAYEARIVPFAERIVLPRARREAALAEQAARFAATLEAACRRSPLDWFNFYPFWDQATDGRLPAP
ncbi:MAG: hypothetical protein KatS3mg128_1096 [Silanimonas sp.]|nr:MAG: hypothetical protein KatS3mg127_0752 [Silanimonas sp.]GIX40047.1 MAG: hypothetical protein KatS3mg128_1096 [Silanimonas sp.]